MRPLRTLRSRGLSLLAVVVLLAGTAAPALARMTCVMSGRSVVHVGQADGCCPDGTSQAATVKATCCELTSTQPPRTAFLSSAGPGLPPLEAVVVHVLSVPLAVEAEAVVIAPPFARPPPDTARRLAVIGTFLI